MPQVFNKTKSCEESSKDQSSKDHRYLRVSVDISLIAKGDSELNSRGWGTKVRSGGPETWAGPPVA